MSTHRALISWCMHTVGMCHPLLAYPTTISPEIHLYARCRPRSVCVWVYSTTSRRWWRSYMYYSKCVCVCTNSNRARAVSTVRRPSRPLVRTLTRKIDPDANVVFVHIYMSARDFFEFYKSTTHRLWHNLSCACSRTNQVRPLSRSARVVERTWESVCGEFFLSSKHMRTFGSSDARTFSYIRHGFEREEERHTHTHRGKEHFGTRAQNYS